MREIKYYGARFYKCALQVNSHSYGQGQGLTHDISEEKYNLAILKQCRENEIDVVGLADHGSVEESESLRQTLEEGGITVFPGFEISSSEKIHMVCLYSETTDKSQLNGYLAQLMRRNFSELANDSTHPSSLSCEDIAQIILNQQNGFWYAAHMTGRNGLLKLDGSGDNYKHLWKKDDWVIAGQIPGSIDDLEGISDERVKRKYREIIENKNPDYKRTKPIAIINAKDVWKPEDLSVRSASCLIKMTKAEFSPFRNAFHDPESRICLNHNLPEHHFSRIESIEWKGTGFFNDNKIRFSKHLNAFIGGRGTGKTTLIESIRYALGLDSGRAPESIYKNNLYNAQIILEVYSKAQNGQTFEISRRYGEQPVVKYKNGEISHLIPKDILPEIEILGQSEILEIEKDVSKQRALIDRFLPDIERYNKIQSEIKNKLQINRKHLVNAWETQDREEQQTAEKNKIKEQTRHFQKLGIEDKLKNAKLLNRERTIIERVDEQTGKLEKWLDDYDEIFDLAFLNDATLETLPGKAQLKKLQTLLQQLKNEFDVQVDILKQKHRDHLSLLDKKKHDWNEAAEVARNNLMEAIARLPEYAGKSGKEIGNQYTQLLERSEILTRQLQQTGAYQNHLKQLQKERESLLEEYRQNTFERFSKLSSTLDNVNKDKLSKKIRIKITRGADREALKNFLLTIDGIGETKVAWVDAIESVPDLIQWSKWLLSGNEQALLKTHKTDGLTSGIAEKLKSLPKEKLLELQEIELQDKPSIELNVAHKGGETYRHLEDLSTGQRCTAILNLLLLDRDDPLIIDQPEDHLDNAFIAERIVQDLRKFKTDRQFLFATHNANIPVFGDAELIVVLSSKNINKTITEDCLGSIDKPEIQKQAADILEGGRAAFDMRKRKYGFDHA